MGIPIDWKTRVRCPIFGFIYLSDLETEIINHEIFQRLRRIKQLSLTDMVYPSATHTRFEHSLGVMQMASDMFDNIIRQEDNREKLDLKNSYTDRIRKIIRLAALLHDIGHPPFSHAGEEVMPSLPEDHLVASDSKELKKYKHEHYSRMAIEVFFKDMIENHRRGLDGISIDAILLLLGEENVKKHQYLTVFKELIVGQIDADRADYLLRDSYHLGVHYGHYDKDRFVNCITIGENETDEENEKGAPVLAIEYGGWQVAESLVLARYNMFTSVYFHKTRRIYDYHIGEALKEVLKSYGMEGGTFPTPLDDETELKKYFEFDDWRIYGALKEGKGGKHGSYILNRKHYKQKGGDWKGILTEDNEQEIEALKLKYENHFLDKSLTKEYYKPDDNDIKIFKKKTGETVLLSQESQIINQIGRPEITRFYAE